jgi:hypothetical protein
MRKTFSVVTIIFFSSIYSFGQEVAVPNFNDKYSDYVQKLESGATNIDYKSFRFSFIESKQFILAHEQLSILDSLKRDMYDQMSKSDYQKIIKVTKEMLSIDYTSLIAHKILRQTYRIIGDSINAKKYKAIQFGLLRSITDNGNGKSCETAWQVIQIEEEYFILNMLDAKLLKQSICNKKGFYDKLEVNTDEGNKTYYFETSKVFEGYNKLGMK